MTVEDVLIFSIGSYEYHGAEMPVNTDSNVIAQHNYFKLSGILNGEGQIDYFWYIYTHMLRYYLF